MTNQPIESWRTLICWMRAQFVRGTRWLAVVGCVMSSMARADWPQFQGPTRNGHSPETGLLTAWPEAGPSLAWTFRGAGLGYSSPAVVDQRIYLSGAQGETEKLLCLDANTGQQLWATDIGPKFDFEGNSWGGGPRSTASVHDGLVYALGGGGNLICVDAGSGALKWSKHMMQDLGGQVNPIGGGPGSKPGEARIGWGYSWAPLVDGEQLICFPGGAQGALAALDRKTGQPLWRSQQFTAEATYASPIVAEIAGVRQYIVLHNAGLTGIQADNGHSLWNWEKSYPDVVIPTPIYTPGQIYVSAGGNPSTCGLVKITHGTDGFSAEMTYASKATRVMKNQVGGSVVIGDFVYGYSDKTGWVCQELHSGDQRWAARGVLKAGSLITAEGLLYCYDEDNAEIALVEVNPDKFVMKSKFKLPEESMNRAPSGRTWTPPVISNGHLFLRDQELLFCYRIERQ
ncbi:MAG: PQQ-binding-like beta-propeller repeat protein [Pirellulaceae bacterium]|nr:PQQ-binding-like beta-propeller repeat protein [Pirellulaceae bacterium]